jgi:hypothetical protein
MEKYMHAYARSSMSFAEGTTKSFFGHEQSRLRFKYFHPNASSESGWLSI